MNIVLPENMRMIIDSFISILLINIACYTCQDVLQNGPMSHNGNLFKDLNENTGNSINGMPAYIPRGNMAAMTGYGQNCPLLQGMTIQNAQSSSIQFGMNPIRPFMGMPSGCSCTLTVNMRGCFICPCGNNETPIPTTDGRTLTTPTTNVIHTGSPRSTSARPSHYQTSGLSSALLGKVNEDRQPGMNWHHENNVLYGENKGQKSTPIPSLMSEKIVTGLMYQISKSDQSIKLQNLSDTETSSGNFSSLQHQTRNVEDLSSERSFPFAVSLGSLFLLTCAVCCVLAYLLFMTRKHIKHHRNELYFVEKSFRQSTSSDDDSMKSADEIIYSLIGKRKAPILPARSPPLTPTAPPVSSATSSGQTCFSFPSDDIRHDYLELI